MKRLDSSATFPNGKIRVCNQIYLILLHILFIVSLNLLNISLQYTGDLRLVSQNIKVKIKKFKRFAKETTLVSNEVRVSCTHLCSSAVTVAELNLPPFTVYKAGVLVSECFLASSVTTNSRLWGRLCPQQRTRTMRLPGYGLGPPEPWTKRKLTNPITIAGTLFGSSLCTFCLK